MDRRPAGSVLDELAGAVGDRVVLWRGGELTGSDIDLLVLPDGEDELAATLARLGRRPGPGDPGHVVWVAEGAGELPVDVLSASAWPAHYPALSGLLARASSSGGRPPVASEEDRLLILAAEAVAGRPLAKLAGRAGGLLARPGAPERLRGLAAAEGEQALAALVSDPERLAARGRRGRLTYGDALRLAAASPAARAALRARLGALGSRWRHGLARRVARAPRASRAPGARGRRRRGLVIALSGMDGSGKSSAAETIHARVEAAGLPATMTWGRLGADARLLDRIAAPAKRLLRRTGTVADPVAAGGPRVRKQRDPAEAAGRRSWLSWGWIVIVAAANGRYLRRAARPRRAGVTVVCDRWLVDSLVDLELRYGRHRVAELALSLAAPSPDLAILLEVDAATAARRKPEDQAAWVLEAMQRAYRGASGRHGLLVVDARAPREQVDRELASATDRVLAEAGLPAPEGPPAARA